MRIRYLSDAFVPSASANSVQIMKMCGAFSKHGHDVVLSAHRGEGNADVYSYYGVSPTFEIVEIRRSRIPGVKRLRRILSGASVVSAARTVDLVYGRDLYGVLAIPSYLPFIYEAHMVPHSLADRYLTRKLLERENLQRFVVISRGLAEAFKSMYPWFPTRKLLIAHDGADEPAHRGRDQSSLRCAGRAGVVQLGYVGSLYPGKGQDTVVELARKLPEFDFHIVGGRPDEVARIRDKFSGENLFLHGYVPHHLVPELMRSMDIALLPAQKNVQITKTIDIGAWMSPLKLFEYMSARLPIVGSALPVIEEVLTSNLNSVLVPPRDIDAWVGAVRRLASDKALRKRLADHAYMQFATRHTWLARAERVLEGF